MSKINTVHWASRLPLLDKTKKDTKGRFSRTAVILITAGGATMTMLVAWNSGSLPPTPPPEGASLLETRSVCHSTDRVKRAKKTRKQWEQTVGRMIGKGAQLTEAEKAVLVDYLAKTYGP